MRGRSVPVTFHVNPAAWTLFPAAGDPFGTWLGPTDIVALDPGMFAAIPPPMTRLPVLDRESLCRQDGNDLDARRRRRHRHINLGLKLRHGRTRDGCGAGQHGEAEQAATREAVHRLLRITPE